jgi:6-phosphogluconolactonase (cycloisomerase 2 family)
MVTGIMCFPRSQTNGIAFDSTGHVYVSVRTLSIATVYVFASGADNCAKPKRTISDGGGLAIDSNNLLYVANSTTATIDIFPSGSGTMTAQIGGSNTGLVAPGTVAIDASRNVYVFDNTTATISEFAAGATGNVAPIRTIAGSNTGLNVGDGFNCALAVSKKTGNIFVSNPTSNAILVFAATAKGNVAPIQTIAGSATQLSNPLGLTVTE